MVALPLMAWHALPEPNPKLTKQLRMTTQTSLHPLVVKHLQSLGFQGTQEMMRFLFPKKEHLHTPWRLKGMEEAVRLLEAAITGGQHITVVGDYDVDGVCGTTIAVGALERLGAQVDFYLPHRKKEGYGIKPIVVERLKERGTEVVVTVDNGITAQAAVEAARQAGITTIITDHHQPGETLPEADVLINPNQAGCPYPFKGICGAGVAYKLGQALYEYLGMDPDEMEERFLPYVTIATIADVMPLRDENRYLVQEGLRRMRKKPPRFLKALLKVLQMDIRQLSEESIGFYIAPTLNAPGRLDSAEDALRLLRAQTPLEAAMMANVCHEHNRRRQALVEAALQQAKPALTTEDVQVLSLDVEEGIAGIVAGHVKERLQRPTFIFSPAHTAQGELILKGSARSIPGFSLFEALQAVAVQHPTWFINWGGHAMAAGVSLDPHHLESFRQAINEVYRQQGGKSSAVPTHTFLATITEEEAETIVDLLAPLAPFGMGNPRPRFEIETSFRDRQVFGAKQNHLRLHSEQGFEYTWFRGGTMAIPLDRPTHAYVTLGRSFFAGRERLDRLIEDVRPLDS